MSEPVWDRGLQAERTRLAWRRTVLAVVIVGLFSWRALPVSLGVVPTAVAVAGLITAGVLGLLAHRRTRRRGGALLRSDQLPGAELLAVLGVLVAAIGAVALVVTVLRHLL